MSKLIRFPEGAYTESEWVERFADYVEVYHSTIERWYNRVKFNRMDANEQSAYIKELEAKAAKQRYRAWRGDTFYDISKSTFEASNKKKV